MSSQSIPTVNTFHLRRLFAIPAGTLALCLLSQIAIPLPFSPVPLTGQTFGIALNALLLGRKSAMSAFGLYLGLGAVGFPVFALGSAGLHIGPTLGYLLGMAAASWLVGGVADRGLIRSFGRAWWICLLGSALVFAFGLAGLSFFVPANALLKTGLLPFIPGDLIKTTLAASVATTVNRLQYRRH